MGIIFHIDVNSAYLSWTAVKLLKEAAKDEKVNPIMNWGRAHGLSPRNIAKAGVRGAGRTIKGATKFATKTAFKAGVGTLAGIFCCFGRWRRTSRRILSIYGRFKSRRQYRKCRSKCRR